MPNINALTKNVRDLLDNKKYSIEYYQREYRWGEEQIVELLTDLEDKFFEDYEDGHQRNKVKSYPPYFLGSIILVEKNNQTFVIVTHSDYVGGRTDRIINMKDGEVV